MRRRRADRGQGHIVDGDTLDGSDGITYRLAAIDAPEAGTELGPAATQRLAELLTGPLTIELGEVASIDRYGRTLA
jgi:endonuclease YncB( thermonuclease family)